MIYVPVIGAFMIVTGGIGLILIAIGKTWRYVLLGFFFYLALFEVSLADEVKWQLVFIVEGEIVEYGEPKDTKRDCMRHGYLYINDELKGPDEELNFDGFLCDRVPPLPPKKAEIPVCTEPIAQCS